MGKSVSIAIIILAVALNAGDRPDNLTGKNRLTLLKVIESCIRFNYDIRKSEINLKVAEGKFREQKGVFDFNIFLSASHSLQQNTPRVEKSDISDLGIRLSKFLGNGVLIGLNIKSQRFDFKESGGDVLNYGTADLSLQIPLLRGAGKTSVKAESDAAALGVENQQLLLKNRIRKSVLEIVTLYWQYVAEYQVLAERRKAEMRAEKLIKDSKELIRRKEVAPAEIIQYQGNLGNKVSVRIAQEQVLYEVRLKLGKLMGMKPALSSSLPEPSDGFPELSDLNREVLEKLENERVFSEVFKNRLDLKAIEKSIGAADRLFRASERDTSSDLKLQLTAGYNGYLSGNRLNQYLKAPFKNLKGVNYQAGIVYSIAPGNNIRRGVLEQRLNELKQLKIVADEFREDIRIELRSLVRKIKGLIRQYRYVRQSTENYSVALKNEQIKYRMNMSTQINIIETEENFIEAAVREIRVRKELAEAITGLRYTMGMLGNFPKGEFAISFKELVSFPLF